MSRKPPFPQRLVHFVGPLAFLFDTALPHSLPAAEPLAMVLQNGGLKHLYRVVIAEFDEKNEFASGALEIYSQDDEERPETRLPFAATLKKDPKNKGIEILEIRGTTLLTFFPPANTKEPFPPITPWKLTGRKSGKGKLKATLWQFDSSKNSWVSAEWEFEEVPRQ